MQVPQEKRFDKASLFIVSGSQVAKVYYAHGTDFDEIGSVENKMSEYEIHNENAAPGKTYGKDQHHVDQQTIVRRDFGNELKEALRATDGKEIERIYIFCPGEVEKEIREVLSAPMKEKIEAVIHGNYVKNHPLELLEKI